jgi:hypothetical protein
MFTRCAIAALAGFLLLGGFSSARAAPSPPAVTPTPSPTPRLYSSETLLELKKLQEAALASDYAYRQVAHLSNNIGPRLSGSAQAQKAVEYVADELKAIDSPSNLRR